MSERWRARAAATRFATLATLRPDGSPHVVPISHVVVEDVILFAIDRKPKSGLPLQRLRNIQSDPRVSVLFDHRADDWEDLWWVRADGLASIHRIPPPDAAQLVRLHPQYRTQPPVGPWVSVAVERWTGWVAAGPA